jgi:hypothetical protein
MPDPFVDRIINDLGDQSLPPSNPLVKEAITTYESLPLPLLPRGFNLTIQYLNTPCPDSGDISGPDTRPDTGMLYPRG